MSETTTPKRTRTRRRNTVKVSLTERLAALAVVLGVEPEAMVHMAVEAYATDKTMIVRAHAATSAMSALDGPGNGG
jgi:hypothetical protein